MKSAQPNKNRSDPDAEGVTQSDVQIWGLMSAAVAVPVFFIVMHFAGAGKGRAAAVSSAVMVFGTRVFWRLRHNTWYWLTISILAAIHISLVLLVPWTSEVIPAPALAPVGIADFVFVYCSIKLVEKIMMRSKAGHNGNG
jgi:hypothetical protein